MNLVNGIRERLAAERGEHKDGGAVYQGSHERQFMTNCKYCGQPIDWMAFQGVRDDETKEHPVNPGTFEFHAYTCPNQPRRNAWRIFTNPNVVMAPQLNDAGLTQLMNTLKNALASILTEISIQMKQTEVKRELAGRLQAQIGELELMLDKDSQRHFIR